MAEDRSVRIDIGFDGGQTLSELVAADQADALEKALHDGKEPVFALSTSEGRTLVALGRVLYLKRREHGSRVGFGG
jgi:hypothetical protein